MNTETIVVLSVWVLIVVFYFITRRDNDITVTIKMEEGFPLKDDGVVDLEVPAPIGKSKRAYNKRPAPITKINTVAKKPVGRPRKSK